MQQKILYPGSLFIAFFRKHWILLAIIILALSLRTYKLDTIPPGLHGDEVSIGYNAYSLLKTAHDQNGNFLPIAIDQFGDFRPSGYFYIDIPFVAVLGLTATAVRLPSALFGAISILFFYFLLDELFQKREISLIGAFLLAINPWHINISRATSEGVIAIAFVLLGVFFFLKYAKNEKKIYMLYSFLSFFISFFFYHAPRIFVPLFLLPLIVIFIQGKKHWKTRIFIPFIAYVFIVASLGLFILFGHGLSRASEINIFTIPGSNITVKQQLDEEGNQNPVISRFFHNKFFFYGSLFLENYFQHYDGNFLFVKNGLPIRYRIPWTGNFYIIELPFLLIGLAFLLTDGIKTKNYVLLLPIIWLIIGGIPAGLTYEDIPNVERASLMIPALLSISAYGFYMFLQLKNKLIYKKIFLILVLIIFLQNISYFLHNYFYNMPIDQPWFRSAGESNLIYTIDSLPGNYPVVMTTQNNNNLIFNLFYNKFDPATFQKLGSPKEHDGLQFGNVKYTYNPCPISGDPKHNAHGNLNFVFVDKPDCNLPRNAVIIKTITYPDGIPAFNVIKLVRGDIQYD